MFVIPLVQWAQWLDVRWPSLLLLGLIALVFAGLVFAMLSSLFSLVEYWQRARKGVPFLALVCAQGRQPPPPQPLDHGGWSTCSALCVLVVRRVPASRLSRGTCCVCTSLTVFDN